MCLMFQMTTVSGRSCARTLDGGGGGCVWKAVEPVSGGVSLEEMHPWGHILRCCSSSSFRFSQSLATVDTMYFVTMME